MVFFSVSLSNSRVPAKFTSAIVGRSCTTTTSTLPLAFPPTSPHKPNPNNPPNHPHHQPIATGLQPHIREQTKPEQRTDRGRPFLVVVVVADAQRHRGEHGSG